jgi:hypothetical protein
MVVVALRAQAPFIYHPTTSFGAYPVFGRQVFSDQTVTFRFMAEQ